jgi:hypothetical protein
LARRHSLSARVSFPVIYKPTSISLGFRADILVADAVVVEIKGVAGFIPAHDANSDLPAHEPYSHRSVDLPRGPSEGGLQRFVVAP